MSLKSGSDIRLKKETGFLQVDFNSGVAPAISAFSDDGWTVLAANAGALQEDIYCLWQDTIDVSGVQMADLSMVNQGTGVVRRGVHTQASLFENLNIIDMHVVSLVPLNLTAAQWVSMSLGLDSGVPLTDDRLLMVNIASFKRGQQDSSFTFSQNDGAVYGSASTFSNTRLHVYRYVAMYRVAYITASPGPGPTPAPFAGSGIMTAPNTSVAQLCKLQEFDSVATAYAIYRGNDLQQTFDN